MAAAALGDRHAALVQLCRSLAVQLDTAGESASTRLTAAYLSALKDVDKAAVPDAPPAPTGKLTDLIAATQRARVS